MSYVIEYIPEEDLKKYNFEELNRRPRKGGYTGRDWAINREEDIWLHAFYTESDHTAADGGFTGVSAWDFYWKGTLMLVEVKDVASGGGKGKPRWTRKRLLSINIPSDLEGQRSQIIRDLETAFTAYRWVGVLSSHDAPSYTFTLEV